MAENFAKLAVIVVLIAFILIFAGIACDVDWLEAANYPMPVEASAFQSPVTPTPTNAPDPGNGDVDNTHVDEIIITIVDLLNELVAELGLASVASAIVMLLSYLNIVKDGWGGRVYLIVGALALAISLVLPTDVRDLLFNLMRPVGQLILALLGGAGVHYGASYFRLKPARRERPVDFLRDFPG